MGIGTISPPAPLAPARSSDWVLAAAILAGQWER